jgi:hypothetical protein
MTRATAVLFAAFLLFAAQANAQRLSIQLHDGFADVEAENVPLRQILEEWARVGGVVVSNADKTSPVPVSLTLTHVPEKAALATLLREVSGYMLAPRGEGSGSSAFSRILILPTSGSPRPVAATTSVPAAPRPAAEPPAGGRGRPRAGAAGAGGEALDAEDRLRDIRDRAARGELTPPRTGDASAQRGDPGQTTTQPVTSMPAPPPGPATNGPAAAPGAGSTLGSPIGSSQPGTITPVPAAPPPQRSRPPRTESQR